MPLPSRGGDYKTQKQLSPLGLGVGSTIPQDGSTAGEEVVQPADGGIPTLLLEPGHGADAGPDVVPLGYVPGGGGAGRQGWAARRDRKSHV